MADGGEWAKLQAPSDPEDRVRRRPRWILTTGAVLVTVALSLVGRAPVAAGPQGRPGPTGTASAAGAAVVEDGNPESSRRLEWIVSLSPRDLPPEVADCLDLGASCPSDALLELDTARLRADGLATALAAALDPTSPAYLGEAEAGPTAAARRAMIAAAAFFQAVTSWLEAGCGGNIEDVVGITPGPGAPEQCAELTDETRGRLRSLREIYAS